MSFYKALITLSIVLFAGCYTQLLYAQNVDDQEYEEQIGEEYFEGNFILGSYNKYSERWESFRCNPYTQFSFEGEYNYYWPYYYPSGCRPGYFTYYWGNTIRHPGPNYFFVTVYSLNWPYDPFFYSAYRYSFYNYRPEDELITRYDRHSRSLEINKVYDNLERDRVRNERSIITHSDNSERSRSTIRTRSIGSSRIGDTVNRSRNTFVNRSHGDNDRSVRTRNRGIDNTTRARSRGNQQPSNRIGLRAIDLSDRIERINYSKGNKEWFRNKRVPSNRNVLDRFRESYPTLFKRIKGFWDSSSKISVQRSSTIRIGIPSSVRSSSTVGSSSSNNHMPVIRSNSLSRGDSRESN